MPPEKNRNHPVKDEVAAIECILKGDYPEYYRIWSEFYDEEAAGKGNVCRGANMFITTYAEYDEYCRWLFDILFKMRDIVGDKSETERNMRRYCAYMGERLLSVYLETNGKTVRSVKIKYKKWWLPYLRRIRDALGIDRKSRLYMMLRNKFGYRSSYKN